MVSSGIRKPFVHPMESLWIGRIITHDPVEVIGIKAVKIGTQSVDLKPQSQPVGFFDGPMVLPLNFRHFGILVLEPEPFGGETTVEKCQPSGVCNEMQ